MADVSVDSTVSTSTARGGRSVVFTTDQIGYVFYLDSDGVFGYSKTTDGGGTWGAQVNIDGFAATTTVAFDVWYDRWTPGDTGTLIHCWWFDVTNDDINYNSLDTSSDTISNSGTPFPIISLTSAVAGRGAFISGTKARSGNLFCAYDIDAGAERGFHRESGGVWAGNLSTTFIEATLDTCLLFPASGTGDNNDIWALYYDASALALTLKLWDFSATSATESATIGVAHTDGATDLTGQFGYSGAIRHSDGHLIVAALSGRDVAASTHQVFDITSTSTITTKTAIAASTDDHYYPQVFIDQSTNDLYVAYNGKRDGTEVLDTTTKVYYTKSTDGGTTWTSGDTAYMEGTAGVVQQVWTPLSGARFYAVWRVGTTLLGNKVNSVSTPSGPAAQSVTGATITSTSIVQSPQVVTPGAVTLTGTTIAAGSSVTTGHTVAPDQAVTGTTLASTASISSAHVVSAPDQFLTGAFLTPGVTTSVYTSSFTGTESPLSESGAWAQPASWQEMRKSTGAYAFADNCAAYLVAAVSSDQYSEITVDQDPGTGSWAGVLTRMVGTTAGGYLAILYNAHVYFYEAHDTGSFPPTFNSLAGSGVLDLTVAPRRLRLTSIGNTHTVTFNGVDVIVYTDTVPYFTAGKVGLASSVFGGPTLKSLTFDGGNAAAPTVFAGTIDQAAGAQSVSGATIASTAQLFSGVVSPGAVTLSGATLGSTATITPGVVSTLTTVSGATLASASTVTAGSVTTTTAVSGTTLASTLVLRTGTVTTTTAVSGATLASGAILFTGQTSALVGGVTLASTALVRAGAIAVNVSGATVTSTATLVAGSLSPSGAFLPSTAVLFGGTALPIGALGGATIASSLQLFAGSVSTGAVTVTGGTIPSSASVTPGSVTTTTAVSGATRPSTATLFPGAVAPGAVTLTGATIASSVVLFSGQVITGAVALGGATRPSTATLFPGSVTAGAVTVLGATLASTTTLFPGRTVIGLPVTGAIILSGATLTPGLVIPGPVTVVGATLTAPAPSTHVFPGHVATATVICSVEFPIDTDSLLTY